MALTYSHPSQPTSDANSVSLTVDFLCCDYTHSLSSACLRNSRNSNSTKMQLSHIVWTFEIQFNTLQWIRPLTFFYFFSEDRLVEQLDQFVDYLTDLVDPQKRADLNVKRWHKTSLLGNKVKTQDQKKKKKTKAKSKQLSRSQLNELGLYTLPTKALKYTDVLPLHDLWLEYIFNHLRMYLTETNGQHAVPNVYDSNYDAFSKALVKSDFHGAKVTVIASCNASVVGQTGIVAMETKNTFKIVGQDDRIRSKWNSLQKEIRTTKSEFIFSYSKDRICVSIANQGYWVQDLR